MKVLVFLFVVAYSICLNAQDVIGTYVLDTKPGATIVVRSLTLNADNTFVFYGYEKHKKRIPAEVHVYGKGTWSQDNKVIYFTSKTSDIDEKHTLNFNNSKARYISKSPRDKSSRAIKTAIRFYESEVGIAKGLTLVKK